MKFQKIVILASLSFGFCMADDSVNWAANIGLEVSSGKPAYQISGASFSTVELGDDVNLGIVGQGHVVWSPSEGDNFNLFAGYRFGSLQNPVDGVQVGATLYQNKEHSLALTLDNFAFGYDADAEQGFGEMHYNLSYLYDAKGWSLGASLGNEYVSGKDDNPAVNDLVSAGLHASRHINLAELWNSQLVVGSSVALSSASHANHYFSADSENTELDFAASAAVNASWIVPLSQHWLTNVNASYEFLSDELENSSALKDHQALQVSTGIRYVF